MEKVAFADTQAVTVTSAMQSEALTDARQVNLTSASLTSDSTSYNDQLTDSTSFSASNSSSISESIAKSTSSISLLNSPSDQPEQSAVSTASTVPAPTSGSSAETKVVDPVTEDDLTLVSAPLTDGLATNIM